MKFDKKVLVKAMVMAFGGAAVLYGAPALAQSAAAPASAASAASDATSSDTQRVIVTGSSIRRTDSETPSPVQVITAADIQASGYTSIQDVLHNITANGQGTLSQGFTLAFASGASGISLRGLETGATLVLIDGHRSAPYPIGDDGQRSFVDISNLPFSAVERIEVLKDGASAEYGSDAIAGVVNIILKKSYTGAMLTADVGDSYKNDGTTRHASGMYGIGDLASDGYNAYVAVEIRKQDPIKYDDRGGNYTKTDFTSQGGLNITPGVPNAANAGLPASTTGYVVDPNSSPAAIAGFMPGCNATKLAAGQCSFTNNWSELQPTTENYNTIVKFTKNLPADWQLSVAGTFFDSKARQVSAPSSTFTSGYQGITSGPGVTPTLLTAVGPTTISSTNPSFPTGTGLTSGLLYYTFTDLGPTVTDTDAKTTRFTADLAGSLGAWDLSAAAGYSQVRLGIRGYNNVNAANLQTALDSTTDPYLVGEANSAAVDAFIAPELTTDDVSKLLFAHAGASRELYQLPGGPLTLALGMDYVHRYQNATAPTAVEEGLVNSFSNNYTIGHQDVASADFELDAPLLKTLDADFQARYDHYNLSGGRTSPKLGMKWTPTPEFALRGTASRGFRAPGPAENGTAGQTYFTGNSVDPVLCANPSNVDTPGNYPTQCSIAVGTVQSTNAKLKPETSTSYTVGTIIEPIKGYSASIDFYSIAIANQIVAGSSSTAVRGTNLTPIPFVEPDGTIVLQTPTTAPIAYYQTQYVNANKTSTNGVDVDLTASKHFALFDFKTDFQVTYIGKYDLTSDGTTYHLAGTHGPLVVGGDTGNPRTHASWANTYEHGPLSITGTWNFISGYSLLDPSYGVTDCLTALEYGAAATAFSQATTVPTGVSCKVGSFFTFDLQGHYDVNKHLTLSAAVLNLFNQGAPLDWATYGGGSALYNPSLHQQGAIGRYMTVGATYKF